MVSVWRCVRARRAVFTFHLSKAEAFVKQPKVPETDVTTGSKAQWDLKV